jgi:hypothetical protein
MMNIAGVAQEIGRAADMIRKLRIREGGKVLREEGDALGCDLWPQLLVPPLDVLPPYPIAEH